MKPKIGYIINTYPAPSHSFIRREIIALERRGYVIHRFAMRPYGGPLADAADCAEAERTTHVLSRGVAALALSVIQTVFIQPRRFWVAASLAWRMARVSSSHRWRQVIYLMEAAWLYQRTKELQLERLHAHFGTNSAAVTMLAWALGAPAFSFTVHGPDEFDRPESLALGLKLEKADFVVAVSSYGRSQLCRWIGNSHWEKLKVVPCGIDIEHYRDPAPLPNAVPLKLVSVGRFAEQKGHLLLIQALAEVEKSGVDWHLTLVGDGPLRTSIVEAIREHGLDDKITLTGWLDEAGVRSEVERAHALVLASFAEGLPMVLMEAMAASRPVVATWVAGIPELVENGKNGWLVPAGDVDALKLALCDVAQTSMERLMEMGAYGRKRALARHNVGRSAEALADYFSQRPRAQLD